MNSKMQDICSHRKIKICSFRPAVLQNYDGTERKTQNKAKIKIVTVLTKVNCIFKSDRLLDRA